ncbi:hypothetical protein DOT_3379 [Desulfosporosinus sp. OT]|nr:hypothetical protein DOT_3379 [Desulfosporosinus sp. OT]
MFEYWPALSVQLGQLAPEGQEQGDDMNTHAADAAQLEG